MPPEKRVQVPIVYDIEFVESPDSLFKISDADIVQRQNQKLEAAGLAKRKRIVNNIYLKLSFVTNILTDF